jgi:hypothetical protein
MDSKRLAEIEAVAGRLLPDGRELFVIPRLYNSILTIGPASKQWHDDHW